MKLTPEQVREERKGDARRVWGAASRSLNGLLCGWLSRSSPKNTQLWGARRDLARLMSDFESSTDDPTVDPFFHALNQGGFNTPVASVMPLATRIEEVCQASVNPIKWKEDGVNMSINALEVLQQDADVNGLWQSALKQLCVEPPPPIVAEYVLQHFLHYFVHTHSAEHRFNTKEHKWRAAGFMLKAEDVSSGRELVKAKSHA
jgi:hypothetical protein